MIGPGDTRKLGVTAPLRCGMDVSSPRAVPLHSLCRVLGRYSLVVRGKGLVVAKGLASSEGKKNKSDKKRNRKWERKNKHITSARNQRGVGYFEGKTLGMMFNRDGKLSRMETKDTGPPSYSAGGVEVFNNVLLEVCRPFPQVLVHEPSLVLTLVIS